MSCILPHYQYYNYELLETCWPASLKWYSSDLEIDIPTQICLIGSFLQRASLNSNSLLSLTPYSLSHHFTIHVVYSLVLSWNSLTVAYFPKKTISSIRARNPLCAPSTWHSICHRGTNIWWLSLLFTFCLLSGYKFHFWHTDSKMACFFFLFSIYSALEYLAERPGLDFEKDAKEKVMALLSVHQPAWQQQFTTF